MERKKLSIESFLNYGGRAINRSIDNDSLDNDLKKEEKNEKKKQQKFNIIDDTYEISEDESLTDDDILNIKRKKKQILDQQKRDRMLFKDTVITYPRIDNGYKSIKSLNFDMMKTDIFVKRAVPKTFWIFKWIAYFFVGVITGFTAFCMDFIEHHLVQYRNYFLFKILPDSTYSAWAFLMLWCVVIAGLASYMTVTIGPGATGSGVPECMAYLNGVNYPNLICFKTFIIKCICVVMVISTNLFVGKEGPLAHIGANIGVLVIYYTPFKVFEYLKNDVSKRKLAAAGISAGVSAAFGAPIGGCLFSYEISKPTTFWSFDMLWMTFFCSAVSTATISFLKQCQKNQLKNLTTSVFAYTKFAETQIDQVSYIRYVHGPIVLGIIGGLLGALFIWVNKKMQTIRKKIKKSVVLRVLETILFSCSTMSVCYFLAVYQGTCRQKEYDKIVNVNTLDPNYQDFYQNQLHYFQNWSCAQSQNENYSNFNSLGTLFFNSEGETIRNLFYLDSQTFLKQDMLYLASIWYLFTVISYGVSVPSGIFLPGIIMGQAMGRYYTRFMHSYFNYDYSEAEVLQNALFGATAMLSGYSRMTYSLIVILLETTNSINLYTPMLVCMLFSYCTALIFNKSLYNTALKGKQIPMLLEDVPQENKNLKARVIMAENPVTLSLVPTVREILTALQTKHPMFPVLNISKQLIGSVSANFLVILLENEAWYSKSYPEINEYEESPNQIVNDDLQSPLEGLILEESPNKVQKGDQVFTFIEQNSPLTLKPENESQKPFQRQDSIRNDNENKIQKDLRKHKRMKQKSFIDLSLREDLITNEEKLMNRIARMERQASEFDLKDLPPAKHVLNWRLFNSDYHSIDRDIDSVLKYGFTCPNEKIDLRPYMIKSPFVCFTTDNIQKCLDIFRHNCLRQLSVINPIDGKLKGVIGREDLFAYMNL